MDIYSLTLLPSGQRLSVPAGQTLHQALSSAGIWINAPCGGRGACGKCRLEADGVSVLACRTAVTHDMVLRLPGQEQAGILTGGLRPEVLPDAGLGYVIAADIGTTTVVVYLLDGKTGAVLRTESAMNPQIAFGGDVISRIQYVLEHPETDALRQSVLACLAELTTAAADAAGIDPHEIMRGCIVGNTAMHHLLLGIDPKPLTIPPYMPKVRAAMELPAGDLLPIAPAGTVRILPNIAGFVGADTVACMAATDFAHRRGITLLLDIGTNGEMAATDGKRCIACSTAAGPAFEGAKIRCGMRGAAGAIDHVCLKDGERSCSVIGGGKAAGICGSGLLDAVHALRQCGMLDETGRMDTACGEAGRWMTVDGIRAVHLLDGIVLTQKDVREFQLAKAAVRAGIDLLLQRLGVGAEAVDTILLAGAFGNYLDPASACAVGLLPKELEDRIVPIGNAAGIGAQLCALSDAQFEYASVLARQTEFLELASMPEFQDRFIDSMMLGEGEL